MSDELSGVVSRDNPTLMLLDYLLVPYLMEQARTKVSKEFPSLSDLLRSLTVTYPYAEMKYPQYRGMETGISTMLEGRKPKGVHGLAIDDAILYSLADPEDVSNIIMHELLHHGFKKHPGLQKWSEHIRQLPLSSLQEIALGFEGYPTKHAARFYERKFTPEQLAMSPEEITIRRLINPEKTMLTPLGADMRTTIRIPEDEEILAQQAHIVRQLSEYLKYPYSRTGD